MRTGLHLEMDLLRAGHQPRVSVARHHYRVILGRASAVEVWFNGQEVDLAPHTRGNVARVTLGGQSDDPARINGLQGQAKASCLVPALITIQVP